MLDERKIAVESDFLVEQIDNDRRTLVSYDEPEIPFDLLVTQETGRSSAPTRCPGDHVRTVTTIGTAEVQVDAEGSLTEYDEWTAATLRRVSTVGGFPIKELFVPFPGKPAKKMAYVAGLPFWAST